MQSGNGMTMQEAEQEIKYYQKIFQVARLLKGCLLYTSPSPRDTR